MSVQQPILTPPHAEAGTFMISPFVARIYDWHNKTGARPFRGSSFLEPARALLWPAVHFQFAAPSGPRLRRQQVSVRSRALLQRPREPTRWPRLHCRLRLLGRRHVRGGWIDRAFRAMKGPPTLSLPSRHQALVRSDRHTPHSCAGARSRKGPRARERDDEETKRALSVELSP